ncbi:MAG: pentapeptide repeat-containing protein, partial [Pseudomonadota bacterium]
QFDPPPFQELLDHIAEIARSAGATLFSFLTISLYFAVALAAHRDADFFAAGVGTKLPVLGIEIPTELFFLGAPFFILVVFVYLQVYLVKLWFALAAAPEIIPTGDFPNRSLDQATYPWIIIDAVLRWKHSLFRRPLGWLASLGALLVGWLLAPLLIGAFWVRSMPYHHEGLTIALGILFWMSVAVAWASRRLALRVVSGKTYTAGLFMWVVGAPLLLLVIVLSWSTTEAGLWSGDGRARLPGHCKPHSLLDGIDCLIADFARNGDNALLVPAALSGASLSQLPDNYLPRDLAYKDFRHAFIVRQRDEFGPSWREQFPEGKWEPAMKQEFDARRAAQHRLVMRRDLQAADLRRADLSRSNVVAASLVGARLSRANLQLANLEGADLSKADLTYAIVSNTQLASATLEDARLVRVNLYRARMQRAHLKRAQLTGSFLRSADLTDSDLTQVKAERASFREAKLDGAKLAGVNLTKARLVSASFVRADLRTATMAGADISKANLKAANMHSVDLRGATLTNARLSGAKLEGARINNAALFRADLSSADLSAANLKGASLASANLSDVKGLKDLAVVFGDSVALSSLSADVAQPAAWANVPGFKGKAVHNRAWKAWQKDRGFGTVKK